jgi:CPA1 family monovalent cation:H+ antiporter
VVQGRYVPRILSSRTRIESTTVWQTFIFLLNALVFVLIGLQLPVVLRTLDWPWPVVVDGIFATFGTMVVVRIAWMFPGAYLPRYLFPKYRKRHPYPPWQAVVVVGWAGMRGVVSLAAALSLPFVLADGRPFPARSLIIFITFAVILGTLVVQGLSLAPLVRWLRVEEDRSGEVEERGARLALAEAALEHLDGAMDRQNLQAHQVHGVRQEYVQRIRALKGLEGEGPAHAPLALSRELRRTAIEAQRRQLLKLRDEEVIGDDVLHRLQHELDLEDVRMR